MAKGAQLDLFRAEVEVRLEEYDVILVNSSAGKDSLAQLLALLDMLERAEQAGVRERLVVVHADLGDMEWAGTRDLAERQARHFGLRFEVVRREQDLLAHIEQRGMWPSSTARYCTSDHKTSQVLKLMTRLTSELRQQGLERVRILNCLGLRAEESATRAKRAPFEPDLKASNGRRQVDRWLPIHDWTAQEVWARIRESGVEYHPAYDAGACRASCVFCVLAPRADLVHNARLHPELAQRYVAVEARIGHRFKADLSMADVWAEAQGLAAVAG